MTFNNRIKACFLISNILFQSVQIRLKQIENNTLIIKNKFYYQILKNISGQIQFGAALVGNKI